MQVYRQNSGGGGEVDTSTLITVAEGSPIKAKVWMGTQAQYDAELVYDNEVAYFITDGNPLN